jgi:hypothetical protein
MSTVTEHDQVREPVEAEEDPDHIYCCNSMEAICGADLLMYDVDCLGECDDNPLCPLCEVLRESLDWVCRFCGEGWTE